MDNTYYLDKFQKGVDLLNKQLFTEKNLELRVGVWLDSVCLKVQKPSWYNHSLAKQAIFFSVWVSDGCIAQNKLYYNIHALKLRELKDYKIKSRDFAEAFRAKFKSSESQWPNVSTKFGPLTLMEGWVKFDDNNLETTIAELATRLTGIDVIIDDLLEERKIKRLD
ncbi:hypothetical protein [Mucilaginibacter sp. dw_454]|uniref:hypothetical protein n=1 Tax=Mucilaginibacter sp. dw_454 TaxID=2720079 RepID=UPI001BD4D7B9|nr:hypothetical protein [Mucilaginibacter sp. dw_454]